VVAMRSVKGGSYNPLHPHPNIWAEVFSIIVIAR
jgi:hypothetical protein